MESFSGAIIENNTITESIASLAVYTFLYEHYLVE